MNYHSNSSYGTLANSLYDPFRLFFQHHIYRIDFVQFLLDDSTWEFEFVHEYIRALDLTSCEVFEYVL
jgi:hypothetical protein